MKNLSIVCVLIWSLFLTGCTEGCERGCSSGFAEEFGADWIIVQMDLNGNPIRCWTLQDTSVLNESSSDGIYWLSPDGHLVHISGLYNRVQVEGNRWMKAFEELNMTQQQCEELQK